MKKYTWFGEHSKKENPFSVIHTENGTETVICITDTAGKADFIATACNQFCLSQSNYDKQMKGIDKNP